MEKRSELFGKKRQNSPKFEFPSTKWGCTGTTWINDISGYGSALVQCWQIGVNYRLNRGKQMYVGRSGARRGEEYDDARGPLRGGPMRVPPVLFLPRKCQMPAEKWHVMERWTRRQFSVHQQSLSLSLWHNPWPVPKMMRCANCTAMKRQERQVLLWITSWDGAHYFHCTLSQLRRLLTRN